MHTPYLNKSERNPQKRNKSKEKGDSSHPDQHLKESVRYLYDFSRVHGPLWKIISFRKSADQWEGDSRRNTPTGVVCEVRKIKEKKTKKREEP